MKKYQEMLKKFRQDRRLEGVKGDIIKNLVEESEELFQEVSKLSRTNCTNYALNCVNISNLKCEKQQATIKAKKEKTRKLKNQHLFNIVGEACDIVVFSENYLSCFDKQVLDKCRNDKEIQDGIQRYQNIKGIYFEDPVLLIDTLSCLEVAEEVTVQATCFMLIESVKNILRYHGFVFEKCMEETCKKILSREGAYDEEKGKWCKFTTEEAKAKWYTPDYNSCKI